MRNLPTIISGLSQQVLDLAPGVFTFPWVEFIYNDKPRCGLYVGDDTRPGTDNMMVQTVEGVRAFSRCKVEKLVVKQIQQEDD